MVQSPSAGSAGEKTPSQIVTALEHDEIRLLGLLALGWNNTDIAARLYIGASRVTTLIKSCYEKIGVTSEIALVLFYIDHVLPIDVVSGYSRPGEKLERWRQKAEQRRHELVRSGEMPPRVAEAAMLLADPAHAGESDTILAALMSGDNKPTPDTYREYIGRLTHALGKPGNSRRGRQRLITIIRLAPLDSDEESL